MKLSLLKKKKKKNGAIDRGDSKGSSDSKTRRRCSRGPSPPLPLSFERSARKLDSRQQVSDGEKDDLRYQCEHLSDVSFFRYARRDIRH